MPYWTTHWGAPLTPHLKGQELYPAMKELYKLLYHALGASLQDHLVLTSSGTEAINHVIHAVYRDVTLQTGKNHFLTAQTDEAPAMMALSRLEPLGCLINTIGVTPNGQVTAQAVADALSPRTALVSLSWGNGLTGTIHPVAEIATLCRQRGVRLHLDATHVIGKLAYDLHTLSPDYLTLDGEPLHAPRGSGLLYVRSGLTCTPLLSGGHDQGGMRAGSLNLAALAGLATALRETVEQRDLVCTEVARLRTQLERGICKRLPHTQVCFSQVDRLPHCTTLLFPGLCNEALLFALNRRGLCASIGGGNFQQLALLLNAAGLEDTLAHSAVSFSLSRETTDEEIDRAIEHVVTAGQALRRLSEQEEWL